MSIFKAPVPFAFHGTHSPTADIVNRCFRKILCQQPSAFKDAVESIKLEGSISFFRN
jgi:hypothetical protein